MFKNLIFLALPLSIVLSGCGGGGLDPSPDNNGPTTISARLSESDFLDKDRYYDIYVADARYSGSARVAMRSDDFDTQFYVYEKDADGDYTLIDSNDDAGSDTSDSDDRFDITEGRTYRIVATSAHANEFGDYQIRFSQDLTKPAQVTTQAQLKAKLSLPKRVK